jgi:flagellar hook-basal body complex protein FliE
MTIGPIPPAATAVEPDLPVDISGGMSATPFADVLRSALNDATGSFERAAVAESAFARGRGGLQEVVLERAQADVVLAVATTAASRAAQSLSAIFNLQV